jgi:glycosyltransferase involved in cell wall biosynthesis
MSKAPLSNMPRVSVVMCAYNGIGLIERAVGDILAQRFDDWELVISDDGSSDGTRAWLAGLDDPRIRVILQDRNLGYVRNKNAAIAAARGAMITQQDQDDRSHPERLARQVAALERSGLDIVACGYQRRDIAGHVRSGSELEHEIVIKAYDPARPYPFWFPALMARREVHADVGPFEEFFAGAFGDDLYWTVRANEQYPILCIPDRLYEYVESAGSITSMAGSDRKLVMGEILETLLKQRQMRGSDDLEDNLSNALADLETRLRGDRKLIARKLQIHAARAIDQRRFELVPPLLRRSWTLDPFNLSTLRTAVYYLRRVNLL